MIEGFKYSSEYIPAVTALVLRPMEENLRRRRRLFFLFIEKREKRKQMDGDVSGQWKNYVHPQECSSSICLEAIAATTRGLYLVVSSWHAIAKNRGLNMSSSTQLPIFRFPSLKGAAPCG